jgi:hypothetical protein
MKRERLKNKPPAPQSQADLPADVAEWHAAAAIHPYDREVMAWCVGTAGISGQMIRDLDSVERRFGSRDLPHRSNGSDNVLERVIQQSIPDFARDDLFNVLGISHLTSDGETQCATRNG